MIEGERQKQRGNPREGPRERERASVEKETSSTFIRGSEGGLEKETGSQKESSVHGDCSGRSKTVNLR